LNAQKRELNNRYGWHILAHSCSEYTRATFFEIMEKPALEIAGLVLLIQGELEIIKLK